MKRREKYMGPNTYVLSERWRILLPEQRQAVTTALAREFKRLGGLSRKACAKADVLPEPYSKHQRLRAFEHACNAGAVKIARELLREIGGHS